MVIKATKMPFDRAELHFFGVNSNTYYNTYENSIISVLNRVYNILYNQSTTTKWSNLCSCRLWLQTADTIHTQPMWDKHPFFFCSKQ